MIEDANETLPVSLLQLVADPRLNGTTTLLSLPVRLLSPERELFAYLAAFSLWQAFPAPALSISWLLDLYELVS